MAKGKTGSYGARYGKKTRQRMKDTEKERRPKCPECGKQKLERKASGIWECRSCGAKVAGGSYKLETEPGEKVRKTIKKGESITEEPEEIEEEPETEAKKTSEEPETAKLTESEQKEDE